MPSASGENLIDALFGGGGTPSVAETVFVLLAALTIAAFVIRERNRLLVMIVSSDLARTAGVNVRRLDLVYLLMFAITIGIGLRYLRVLLMGALIIIPAVTAKGIACNIGQMLSMTVALAALATTIGTLIASWLQQETGPIIVLVAAGGFCSACSSRARTRPPALEHRRMPEVHLRCHTFYRCTR